ncbi:unnamed protein product [Brassica oleracea var. botrytis]
MVVSDEERSSLGADGENFGLWGKVAYSQQSCSLHLPSQQGLARAGQALHEWTTTRSQGKKNGGTCSSCGSWDLSEKQL